MNATPAMVARFRSAGFSIPELMVSIAVAAILLAGVIQLVVTSRAAFDAQGTRVEANEVDRFALSTLKRALRMADHWGGVEADVVELQSAPTIGNDCAVGFSVTPEGLRGFEGATTSPLASCISDANYAAGTDLLVVRYADSVILPSTDPGGGQTWVGSSEHVNTIVVRAAVARRAVIAPATVIGAAAANPASLTVNADLYDASGVSRPDAVATFNHPLNVELYHISPCANPGIDGSCDADDDDGEPVPTLTRLRLEGTQLVREEVVRGVEQLQFQYGVDIDGDFSVERYVGAADVSDWAQVLDVRVGLVVRGMRPDRAVDALGQTFLLPGLEHAITSAATRNYPRHAARAVVQIRNSTRD